MSALVEAGPDRGLVWHHGNPAAEGRAVEAGTAVVELGNREIVQISGPDRLEWLHSLSTQHLSSLTPGSSAAMLFLSPTGHIEHHLHGFDDGERFLGWTEPGHADALVDWLGSMRFMMRVELARRHDLRLLWCGEQVTLPGDVVRRDAEMGGSEVFISAGEPLPQGTPAGVWALEAARIAAGVPRIFLDTDPNTIPNEVGLFATHLDKGCYRGQEAVARIYTLGRPPRRLVQLHLDGTAEALPQAGADLMLGQRRVGFVGSSARHHELGPIALGLVKHSVDVRAQLSADAIPASQEPLVDPEVGLHVRPKLR